MAAEMEYLTIGKTGYGEYTEKKSRFLGEIHPAASEEEAGITATHGSWEKTALPKKRRTTESPQAQPAFLC